MYSLVWYCIRSGILCFLLKCIGIEITKGASTVVPCFLPFVAAVRESREDPHLLHGPVGNRHQALNPGHLYLRATVGKNRKADHQLSFWLATVQPTSKCIGPNNFLRAGQPIRIVEANRQQPVGGSRKPAGESQQVEDGCQQATASRRERTGKLTRESRKPAGESRQVEGGCRQMTASRRDKQTN